jgi:hypothetical protein
MLPPTAGKHPEVTVLGPDEVRQAVVHRLDPDKQQGRAPEDTPLFLAGCVSYAGYQASAYLEKWSISASTSSSLRRSTDGGSSSIWFPWT